MNAIKSGVNSGYEINSEKSDVVMKIEDSIKRRLPIGNRISHSKLMEEMENKYPNSRAVEMAILNLIKKDELQHVEGSRFLLRKK